MINQLDFHIADNAPIPALYLTDAEGNVLATFPREQEDLVIWIVESFNAESRNPDPEAKIERMINELAYERVKHSYLFNVLEIAAVDRKADELAEKIATFVEHWICREVQTEAQSRDEAEEGK